MFVTGLTLAVYTTRMQAYITSFRRNKIDGKLLLRQNIETLHLLGINDADDRHVILNSLRQQLCLTCLGKSTLSLSLSIFFTLYRTPAPLLPPPSLTGSRRHGVVDEEERRPVAGARWTGGVPRALCRPQCALSLSPTSIPRLV